MCHYIPPKKKQKKKHWKPVLASVAFKDMCSNTPVKKDVMSKGYTPFPRGETLPEPNGKGSRGTWHGSAATVNMRAQLWKFKAASTSNQEHGLTKLVRKIASPLWFLGKIWKVILYRDSRDDVSLFERSLKMLSDTSLLSPFSMICIFSSNCALNWSPSMLNSKYDKLILCLNMAVELV